MGNLGLLKMDTYKMDMSKDALFRGEFEVVKELVTTMKDGEAAKNVCDKVIDKNESKNHGQHPQIFLPDSLLRLHEGGWGAGKEHLPRRLEGQGHSYRRKMCNSCKPTETSKNLCPVHGGEFWPQRSDREREGKPSVGERYSS